MGVLRSAMRTLRLALSAGIAMAICAGVLGAHTSVAEVLQGSTSTSVSILRTISDAEAEGAKVRRNGTGAPSERKCLVILPRQIVFPTTKGDPADFALQSGEFSIGSISFGWGSTNEVAKMPLRPRYPDDVGDGLTLRIVRLDADADTVMIQEPKMVWGVGNGTNFYATFPRFPTLGRWMILAVAGANWGCFVLDRP